MLFISSRHAVILLLVYASVTAAILCAVPSALPGYTTSREVIPTGAKSDDRWRVIGIQIVEVGGCQYVLASKSSSDSSPSIVHHGACTNPAHIHP